MMKRFKEEYELAHPERIGEKDAHFDVANYAEWLEEKLSEARQVSSILSSVKESAREYSNKFDPRWRDEAERDFIAGAKWMQNQSGQCEKRLRGVFISDREHADKVFRELSGHPEYELKYCENCFQMTNHVGEVCQKCKPGHQFSGVKIK